MGPLVFNSSNRYNYSLAFGEGLEKTGEPQVGPIQA